MEKSFIEYAFEVVSASKDPVSFAEIWEYVKKAANLSEEVASKKIGQFYTNMLLDGRFVNLGDNQWDLRERHTYESVHIDMNDAYSDDVDNDDQEEQKEEKEYNEVFEEKDDSQDDDTASKEDEEDADHHSEEEFNF